MLDLCYLTCVLCCLQEVKKGMAVAGKTNVIPLEQKTPEDEPLAFANKLVFQLIVTCLPLFLLLLASFLELCVLYNFYSNVRNMMALSGNAFSNECNSALLGCNGQNDPAALFLFGLPNGKQEYLLHPCCILNTLVNFVIIIIIFFIYVLYLF